MTADNLLSMIREYDTRRALGSMAGAEWNDIEREVRRIYALANDLAQRVANHGKDMRRRGGE